MENMVIQNGDQNLGIDTHTGELAASVAVLIFIKSSFFSADLPKSKRIYPEK